MTNADPDFDQQKELVASQPTAPLGASSEHTRAIRQMATQVGFQIGPAPDAFLAKLEPQHITSVLDNTEKENVREDSRKKQFFLGSIVATAVVCLSMCWMFLAYDKPEMLGDLLRIFLTAIVSFAGGLGVGRAMKKPDYATA